MNTEMIAEMEQKVTELREMLTTFTEGQDENADEGNEGTIEQAERALDTLEMALCELVP
jgi:hypothetical protein